MSLKNTRLLGRLSSSAPSILIKITSLHTRVAGIKVNKHIQCMANCGPVLGVVRRHPLYTSVGRRGNRDNQLWVRKRTLHTNVVCGTSSAQSNVRDGLYEEMMKVIKTRPVDNDRIFPDMHEILDVIEDAHLLEDKNVFLPQDLKQNSSLQNALKELAEKYDSKTLYEITALLFQFQGTKDKKVQDLALTVALTLTLVGVEQGNTDAMFTYAGLLMEGIGVAPNKELAVQTYTTLAQKGHPYAQWQLGMIYFDGDGAKQDFKMAKSLFEVCVKNRIYDGYTMLGLMYSNGVGVDECYSKAVEYYKLGDENGVNDSTYNLAFHVLNGLGVEENVSLAMELFEKVAHKGHAESQFKAATLYFEGKHMARDIERAKSLLNINKSSISDEATELLKKIQEHENVE